MMTSMCLSLMATPLEPVNLLDLPEEVLGQLFLAQNPKDVWGLTGPAMRDTPALIRSPSPTLMWAPLGMRYSFSTSVALDGQLAEALDQAAEMDDAVDFGDDGRRLRPPGLEKLLGPRQAARDVLGLGLFPGNLGQDFSGFHGHAFPNLQVGARGEEVALQKNGLLCLSLAWGSTISIRG